MCDSAGAMRAEEREDGLRDSAVAIGTIESEAKVL